MYHLLLIVTLLLSGWGLDEYNELTMVANLNSRRNHRRTGQAEMRSFRFLSLSMTW